MSIPQYTTLQPNLKRNISPQKKHFDYVENPTKSIGKTLLVVGVVLAFTLPVFRSGLKGNLTFFSWLVNHTIFGDPVEFIPREDYERIFEGGTK